MTRNVPASPWPFIGMGGLACAFFLYGASALVAPWWFVAVMLLVWVAFLVIGCRWFTPHPKRLPYLAAIAIAFWFVTLLGASILLDWS